MNLWIENEQASTMYTNLHHAAIIRNRTTQEIIWCHNGDDGSPVLYGYEMAALQKAKREAHNRWREANPDWIEEEQG